DLRFRTPAVVLPDDLPGRGPPLVPVPAPGPVAHAAIAGRAGRALPGPLGGPDARASQPVPRQDRLLPASALSRALPHPGPLLRGGEVVGARARVGPGRRPSRRGR